jgi:hypothetical protein
MLMPRPDRSGSIARVIELAKGDDGRSFVLEVDPLHERPALLKPLNPGFTFALRFWSWTGAAVFWGGFGLAIFWHWWAGPVALALATAIWSLNKRSAADFAKQAFAENPDRAIEHFGAHGLIWKTGPKPQDNAKAVPGILERTRSEAASSERRVKSNCRG